MKTISEIKDNCRLVDGDDCQIHWAWAGASVRGSPRVQAPDFTRDPSGAILTIQHGRRAVWHITTSQPIPEGHIIYSLCRVPGCLNPKCLACGSRSEFYQWIRDSGFRRRQSNRMLASRMNSDRQRKLTADVVLEILGSDAMDAELMRQFGLSRSSISRARRGAPVANFFGGLLR